MKRLSFILISVLILAASCREDFSFEPDVSDFSQLSIVSEISPSGAVEASFLKASFINSKPTLGPIEEANIDFNILGPGNSSMPMEYKKEKAIFALSDANYRVSEGGTYSIRAICKDSKDTLIAKTFIPKAINITNYSTLSIGQTEINKDLRNYNINIRFSIAEPKQLPAYYQILVYRIRSEFSINSKGDTTFVDYKEFDLMDIGSDRSPRNAISSFIHKGGVFVDHSKLNGSSIVLTSQTKTPLKRVNETIRKLMIEIRTLSPEFYYYNEYLSNQLLSNRTDYSYPVTSYSNITNGYGVFAGYNTARTIVELN